MPAIPHMTNTDGPLELVAIEKMTWVTVARLCAQTASHGRLKKFLFWGRISDSASLARLSGQRDETAPAYSSANSLTASVYRSRNPGTAGRKRGAAQYPDAPA
jgi:hypothetical protein